MASQERDILHEVHLRLGSLPGVMLHRFAPGHYYTKRGTPITPVPKGFPDLAGWAEARRYGYAAVWLGVEVKSETGRQSEEQRRWQDWADKAGAIYLLVRSADDAERQLKGRLGLP